MLIQVWVVTDETSHLTVHTHPTTDFDITFSILGEFFIKYIIHNGNF